MVQVKIIKLINGDDIVCCLAKEQLPEKTPLLRLEKPLQIKYVSQLTPKGLKDYIALIKWASYTNDQIITIPKDKIVTITNATEEMTKSYIEVSKKYEVGDRIAQIMIIPHPDVTFIETDELSSSNRGEGGFGSTGK